MRDIMAQQVPHYARILSPAEDLCHLKANHWHYDPVQVANAAALAAYLDAHPLVQRVNYAGLPSHPGYVTNARQATSAGSLLSFETGRCACKTIACCGLELLGVCMLQLWS